ncbi:uncharacterized protein LOC115085291 isoform X5 [Rhinatrema bivittatum]|uniref:uncharacterized protein LOC115085291 isoform X5 n=1 Tax=Rhinatrema bivittatum TaxID=194408 RepID=UPI0011272D1C|nr:uncharacterized protein LOC115085291 isoform X5 [Rhinatrema bivittatum]
MKGIVQGKRPERGLLLWLTTSHLMPAADNYLVARLVNNEAIISVTTVLAHMHCGVECFSYGTTSEELQKTLRALKDLSYFPSVQEDPGSTGHAMAHDTPRPSKSNVRGDYRGQKGA